MASKRAWLKAALAAALVAALGAVALVVALKAFFPEPKVRAWVVQTARRRLGREVRLDGLGVGLRGLTLRGLEVSEAPDFAAGTFLRVESFQLRPSWRALLQRQLTIASVSAEGLSVRVIRGTDGRFNFETLGSSAAAPAPAAAPSAAVPAPVLAVRAAAVSGGRILYEDRTSGASWTVSGLDAKVRGFTWTAPFEVEASLRAKGKAGGRPVDAKVSLSGRADLAQGDRAKFHAEIARLSVEQSGLTLTGSGKVDGLDAPKSEFRAELSAAGKSLLTADGRVALGASGTDFSASARTPGLDTRVLAALGAGLPALRVPAATLKLSGRWSAGALDLASYRAEWAGGRVSGSAAARGLGGAKPAYEAKASFAADTPAIAPGEYPALGLPPKLSVPAGRVEGEASYKDDSLSVTRLKETVPQGTVAVAGTVRRVSTAKPSPDLTAALALNLPAFPAGDLPSLPDSVPPGFVVPPLRVEGVVAVRGDDVSLKGLTLTAKEGSLKLDGAVAGALSGKPVPALEAEFGASLPALTEKELPVKGLPAGLEVPATRVDAKIGYSSRLVRVHSLRLRAADNDLEASGSLTDPQGRLAYDLVLKCRFDLGKLAKLTPETRALKAAGAGIFGLAVTGAGAKPEFAGKMRFHGLGADLDGLPLSDFGATVTFSGRRVDSPDLKGKIAGGNLSADVTLKDYLTKAPEFQLTAALDRFDLGRFLDAKSKLAAERKAPAASAGAAPGAKEEALLRVRTLGRLSVGTLIYPNATVQDVKLGWDLHGVGPDLHGLDGDARLHVGGGRVRGVGAMATQSKLVKVLLFPLLISQKIVRALGGIGFPDLNDIQLVGLEGDYLFRDGLMTLRRSEMESSAAHVTAKGTIDLPVEALDLVLTAQVGGLAPLDVAVNGTFDQPKTHAKVGKFLGKAAEGLIKKLVPVRP
jgi:uncharacterized protein involved in outer membrane biogenesis